MNYFLFLKSNVLLKKKHLFNSIFLIYLLVSIFSSLSFATNTLNTVKQNEDKPYKQSVMAFYSGTFDPPTLAHLQIIKCALGEVENSHDCTELGKKIQRIVVSVNKGGLKDTLTSSVERVLMLKKAH